jgi:hypothetical protein
VPTSTATAPPSPDVARILADIGNGWPMLYAAQIRKLPVLRSAKGGQHDLCWVHRMFVRGPRASDGRRIPLPHACGPSGRYTTEPAVSRWLAALNGQSGPSHIETSKAHVAADRRLERMGL